MKKKTLVITTEDLTTTKILLNLLRMAFSNETLACGLFCLSIQNFRIFTAMLPMSDASL